eukprot:13521457-Alexandrium_andersonii.AAC.1
MLRVASLGPSAGSASGLWSSPPPGHVRPRTVRGKRVLGGHWEPEACERILSSHDRVALRIDEDVLALDQRHELAPSAAQATVLLPHIEDLAWVRGLMLRCPRPLVLGQDAVDVAVRVREAP